MSGQIFKTNFSNNIIFDFLDKYGIKDNTKYYLVKKSSFKKARFNNDVKKFCKNIEKYYFNCKKFYVQRKMNYKRFMTIIRQICKFKHLPFISKIKYDKSNYEIYYYIYPPTEITK